MIHQTWKTTTIPDNWKSAVQSCKSVHPDYKHILWTHETMAEFIKNEYNFFYDTYKSYKYDIQRCDAFRYFVLYKYGGIYLDMDIVCKTKLDSLLSYDLVLSRSSNVKVSYTNSFFMSIPNHPFFKHCINNLSLTVNRFYYLGKHIHIMSSTGPFFLSKMIKNYGKIPNLYLLDTNEFAGDCNVCNETTCKGGVYFKHIVGNSWHSFDSTLYNFSMCNYKKIIIILVLVLILFIPYFNYKKIRLGIKRLHTYKKHNSKHSMNDKK